MTLISAAELDSVQSVARSGMSGTATLLTRAAIETEDGQESVWAQNGNEVPCWVQELTPLSGTVGAISGAVALAEQFSIRLPIGSPVRAGDEIAVGSTIYNVQSTNADSTYPVWLNCACRLIE